MPLSSPLDRFRPRSRRNAEATADLKTDNVLELAPPESPEEERPSVTPETIGEGRGFKERPPESADDALSRAKE